MPDLMTLREAAAQCALSRSTLRRAIWRGDLRCIRLTPASNCPIKIRLADLEDWIEQGARRQLAPRSAERLGVRPNA